MFISLSDLKKKISNKKNYLLVGPGASGKSILIGELTVNRPKYKGRRNQTFKDYNVMFLAPNYGTTEPKIIVNNWIRVLKKNKAIAVVCYVPKDIQIERLVKRLKKRKHYWNKNVSDAAIDKMVEMCINDRLDMIKDKHDRLVLEIYCYKDYFFSYNKLYKALDENKIEFCIVNTFKK